MTREYQAIKTLLISTQSGVVDLRSKRSGSKASSSISLWSKSTQRAMSSIQNCEKWRERNAQFIGHTREGLYTHLQGHKGTRNGLPTTPSSHQPPTEFIMQKHIHMPRSHRPLPRMVDDPQMRLSQGCKEHSISKGANITNNVTRTNFFSQKYQKPSNSTSSRSPKPQGYTTKATKMMIISLKNALHSQSHKICDLRYHKTSITSLKKHLDKNKAKKG